MATARRCADGELDAILRVLVGMRGEVDEPCENQAEFATTIRLTVEGSVRIGELTIDLCRGCDELVQSYPDYVKSTAIPKT